MERKWFEGLSEANRRTLGGNVKTYAAMMQRYNAAIREVRTKCEILDEEFELRYQYNPIHHIDSRLKRPESLVRKMQKKGLPITPEAVEQNLFDVAGVRVICNYIDDVERIAAALLRQDDVHLLKRKDYIASPKPSGYRSLHIVVEVPIFLASETRMTAVEIQIRTIAMDFWATLEHQLNYKPAEDAENQEKIRGQLLDCADEIARVDAKMQGIHDQIVNLSAALPNE